MNLFILNTDPILAAKENCDKHVCKIIIEAAQMLCLAYWAKDREAPYHAKTHMNNHVSKWVRETKSNFDWTVKHGLALCDEYTHRYGKTHKVKEIIEWCRDNNPPVPNGPLTEFRQAVADDCYNEDVIEAYRKYYNKYKAYFAKWTKRPQPSWFDKSNALPKPTKKKKTK